MRKIREKEKERGRNFIRLLFTEASPLTSSSSVAMASHHRQPFQRPPLSLRPPFQCLWKPTIFRHSSSHGWSTFFKSSSHGWNEFFKSSECTRIHVFISGINWTPIHLILWKPKTQGNRSLLGSLFGFLGCFLLSCFLNFARIFLDFPGLLLSGFDMIFTLDVLLLFISLWFFHNLVGRMGLQLCIAYMYVVVASEC